MKKVFNLFIVMIMMIISVTLLSCVKEVVEPQAPNITIIDSSKTIVTIIDSSRVVIGGDTISIDNSSRSYADPEISVGGNTTNTTVNTGGNETSEAEIIIPDGYHVWRIPVPELHFYHQFVGGEDEFFERFYPSEDEVPVGFYDGNSNPTTLSFDFDDWEKMGYSNGKQGADLDKTRDLMILRIYDDFAEVKPFRINRRYVRYAEYGKAYLVGITGQDGNSPNERTGRTLMGVSSDGRYVLLMVAEEATSLEAYDVFHDLFPNSPVMVVGGGNSSRCFLPEWKGTKTVPLVIKVTTMMKL